MQKEKPKRSSHPNHVEFVSPLPMSECISRIERVFKPQGCLWMMETRLRFTPVDSEQCNFYIRKQDSIEIIGKLIYQTDTSTLVTCDSRYTLNIKSILAFFAVFEIVLVGLTIGSRDVSGMWHMLFFIPILAFTFYQANQMRDNLLKDIKLILLYK